MFLFVTQAFWVFIVWICVFVCNLGLFEITEWEPINRGAVWFNSFTSFKTINPKLSVSLIYILKAVIKNLYNFDAW